MTKSSRTEHYDAGHIKAGNPGWATQRRSDASIINARGSTWTQEQLDRIRSFYLAHENKPMQLSELAAEMGKTRQVLSRMARWLGVARKGRIHPLEIRQRVGAKTKERWKRQGHPRGALGMRHTPEVRQKLSESLRTRSALGMLHIQRNGMSDEQRAKLSAALTARLATSPHNVYSRAKRGYRPDLGDTFWRSAWEANYARYLNLLKARGVIVGWEFEADTFWFTGIKRGVMSYLPDFKVTRPNGTVYYVEVKGWMDAKSKTKLKRMKKYHPAVEIEVVGKKQYMEIARKLGGAIPHWER